MIASDTVLLKVQNLWKKFGDVVAAREVSFDVPQGSVISLLGPSGCGKTTTLRCIAGLDSPSAGEITIGGIKVNDVAGGVEVPPEKRSIGMVFQSYAVWPHMTVFQNVAFPLRFNKKKNGGNIREKVHNTLSLVGLADFADRPSTNLSGGQQQRVALARALVAEPQLVLFDEPLSNLDAKLREYMRVEILALQKRLGFTAVYVTHDQAEALALSDQLIIMRAGVVEQQGTPQEIYLKPRTPFIADFMGASNMIRGRIIETREPSYVVVEAEECRSRLVAGFPTGNAAPGTPVVVAFRPELTSILTQEAPAEWNRLAGQVEAALFFGEFVEYSVKIGSVRLKARSRSLSAVAPGTPICLTVAKEDCMAIPAGKGGLGE
jgi:iron(III) transport system ATP-binding protein